MTTRRDWSIYVGRLAKCLRRRDLWKMFEGFGPMKRCDIKYGTEMAYAFIDYQFREDAEDCVKFENGREVNGQNIIVEWANKRKDRVEGRSGSSSQKLDECFRCHRTGHWARDCPEVGTLGRRGGGGRSRSPICRFAHRDLDQSHASRSKSCNRRRRHHSRSHDHRRRSRSNDKKRSRSHSGESIWSRNGSHRSRSVSSYRKTSRAPGICP